MGSSPTIFSVMCNARALIKVGERCTEVNLRRYQPLSRKTLYLREFFSTIGWIEENERRDDPSNDAHP